VILYRISNFPDLLGIGGTLASGRWHTRGSPVVYLSDHPALALLETLAHFEFDSIEDLPTSYKLIRVDTCDANMNIASENILGDDWTQNVNLTRNYGDQWLAAGSHPLFRVPSVIIPHSHNYILNPAHSAASNIKIVDVADYKLDGRLTHFAPSELN